MPSSPVRPLVLNGCGDCRHSLVVNGFLCCVHPVKEETGSHFGIDEWISSAKFDGDGFPTLANDGCPGWEDAAGGE